MSRQARLQPPATRSRTAVGGSMAHQMESDDDDMVPRSHSAPPDDRTSRLEATLSAFIQAQQARDERWERETERQDLRWRSMQHQFQQLQMLVSTEQLNQRPAGSTMLLYVIVALGVHGVVTGVDAGVFLSQSGQESRTSLEQNEVLRLSMKASLGNTETQEVLKREKRTWIMPPINIAENDRGPFPKLLVQVTVVEETVVFNLSGPGADQPPIGLFSIDTKTGEICVTKPLDREQQAKYELMVYGTTEDGKAVDEPMEVIIHVIDMNDNKPVFQQDLFLGSVNETTPVGFEFMTVVATDADEPGNVNSDIRYAILSEDPPLPNNTFSINPVTGGIMLNSTRLDREKVSNYTLTIQAADMEGHGLTALSKAIVTVTDSDDQEPQDDPTSPGSV
ncbi:hypothetical protein ACEWY4_015711 [Coilia grayii]|uniref:Cadherin domain-containing protein n=1 Tax=Coilia grayii TaxID=363190 RepID=A0ABD1JP03_9TELE